MDAEADPFSSLIEVSQDGLHLRAITITTAEAALRLLLAAADLEPPHALPPSECWPVFKVFCTVPTQDADEGASFQTELITEDQPVAAVRFVRQLRGTLFQKPYVRSAVVQFLFTDPPTSFAERDVWSVDYPTLDEFFGHVEELAEFQFAMDRTPIDAGIFFDEPEP